MNFSRRRFLEGIGATGAALAFPGCMRPFCDGPRPKVGLQLYSIRQYVAGFKDPKTGVEKPGVGLAQALKDVAALGYDGVEFAGYCRNDAKALKAMLDEAGLVACGTHIPCRDFGPDKVAATCAFNLAYGNSLLICPAEGNLPPKGAPVDDFLKRLVDFYNRAAEDAAKYGCRVGLHNHYLEFKLKMQDGTVYWDYFFANTDPRVCMEQDVGWAVCSGFDPTEQYLKYPHRSPSLHARENGEGRDVKVFDGILGRPGRPGAKPVDWDRLLPVARRDGVEWFVVECACHQDDLSAVGPSRDFLRTKGI